MIPGMPGGTQFAMGESCGGFCLEGLEHGVVLRRE